jgi:drug/metabolite transporter (DMT)-like permease
MYIAHDSDASSDRSASGLPSAEVCPPPPIRRALLLVLTAIVLGLAGLYLVRAALVDVGGFTLGSPTAVRHLAELGLDWHFWAGGVLILVILLISLELYCSEELSRVVPLYSLSYVLVAVIGQVFLHEHVTLQRWIGIVTIIAGVSVLLRS